MLDELSRVVSRKIFPLLWIKVKKNKNKLYSSWSTTLHVTCVIDATIRNDCTDKKRTRVEKWTGLRDIWNESNGKCTVCGKYRKIDRECRETAEGEVSVAYLPLTRRIYHDIYVFPSDTSDFNYVFLQAWRAFCLARLFVGLSRRRLLPPIVYTSESGNPSSSLPPSL